MPRCPYKGEVMWSNTYRRNMHVVKQYRIGRRTYSIYSDLLHVLGKQFRDALKDDDQNVICICGQPGSGKSTLAIQLAMEIKPGWTLESGYVYDDEDLKEKMRSNSKDQVFLFDEASLAVNSRDSMSRSSRDIIAILDTCRTRHNSVIFCLPSFDDLNKSIRERLCQCRIHCTGRDEHLVPGYSGRGFFQVYYPRYSQFGDTYWQLSATGVFPRLKPELAAQYAEIKQRNQDEYLNRITKKDEEVEEE